MQRREFQDITQLEQYMQTIEWDKVSLVPNEQEVYLIDQAVPQEWTQTLEAEQEELFEIEVLEPLYEKTLQELNEILEISQGDIIENARESMQSFDIDINAIMQEVETIDIAIEIEHDDFGR